MVSTYLVFKYALSKRASQNFESLWFLDMATGQPEINMQARSFATIFHSFRNRYVTNFAPLTRMRFGPPGIIF